jgi:hypothetical protein
MIVYKRIPEATLSRSADFIPYEPDCDPLEREGTSWWKVRIQDIPPTRRDDESDSEQVRAYDPAMEDVKRRKSKYLLI